MLLSRITIEIHSTDKARDKDVAATTALCDALDGIGVEDVLREVVPQILARDKKLKGVRVEVRN
jgi:hypothetical protein